MEGWGVGGQHIVTESGSSIVIITMLLLPVLLLTLL